MKLVFAISIASMLLSSTESTLRRGEALDIHANQASPAGEAEEVVHHQRIHEMPLSDSVQANPCDGFSLNLSALTFAWQNPVPPTSDIVSNSGGTISWGVVTVSTSSLTVSAVGGLPIALSPGAEFQLGTLTHTNNPTFPGLATHPTEVELSVSVMLDGTSYNFVYGISIDETLNEEPCTYTSDLPCADAILINNDPTPQSTTTVDGVTFEIDLIGFKALPTSQIKTLFVSQESSSNSADLYGRLTITNCPPDAKCKDITVDADGSCQGAGSIENGSSDPDEGDTLTFSQNPPIPYSLGDTVVTLTVSDGEADSTCQGTVTVVDRTNPTISCPSNIVQNNDLGLCGANVDFNIVGSDNCGNPSISCSSESGSFFQVGTTSVSCTATDPSNSSAQCSFTVTVNDNEAPAISCPLDITQSNDPNKCGAHVDYDVTGSDNCGNPGISCNSASGSFFQVGTASVTCTATDPSSNSKQCSFAVTVTDDEPPTAICGEGVNPAGKTPKAKNQDGFFTVMAFDNCHGSAFLTGTVWDSGRDGVADTDVDHHFSPLFTNGQTFKYVQAPGAPPQEKKGQGEVDWRLKGNGDAYVIVTDKEGNDSPPSWCLVPPPPARLLRGSAE